MASKRIVVINQEIQKELADLLRTVKDPRVQNTMISITRVETTPDLRFAKVCVSFLEEDKASEAMKGLRASDYVIGVYGQKLVIGGVSDDAFAAAFVYCGSYQHCRMGRTAYFAVAFRYAGGVYRLYDYADERFQKFQVAGLHQQPHVFHYHCSMRHHRLHHL